MADSDALIKSFHQTPFRTCWAMTGGGASVANQVLSIPGGSRTILEITLPYSEAALAEYLDSTTLLEWVLSKSVTREHPCSVDTARNLALAARARARHLDPQAIVLGFGCTASLRSDRPKRGDHRVHLAAATRHHTLTRSLILTKEARSRAEEEDVVSRLLLNLAAEAAERVERVSVPLLPDEEVVVTETLRNLRLDLMCARVDAVCLEANGIVRDDGPRPTVIVAGSFNPVHKGHLGLAEIATKQLGKVASFELTILNADKPALLPEEVRRRSAQFADKADLWLTRAPTFDKKAILFPGAVFVVGADTAARIIDPRFYGDSKDNMMAALHVIERAGCSFLVAGRVDASGRVVCLDDLAVPVMYPRLFMGIPLDVFRNDCSSTQLRAKAVAMRSE